MIKLPKLGLDSEIAAILACPYCKSQELKESRGRLHCVVCYATFEICSNGVVDFRILPPVGNKLFEKYWVHGQEDYEKWSKQLPTDKQFYLKQIEDSKSVYSDFCDLFSLSGILLDVGGSDGRLRHFLPSAQQCHYVSIDPYLTVREDLSNGGRLEAYPELGNPCNFICGMAEHLPFSSDSIDFVRINSVLDHLWDANLGMREIIRVLKPNGRVFIGVSIVKNKNILQSFLQSSVDYMKAILGREDHHIWHPTKEEVDCLLNSVGLIKEKEMGLTNQIQALWRKPLLKEYIFDDASP